MHFRRAAKPLKLALLRGPPASGLFNVKLEDIDTVDEITSPLPGFDSDDTSFRVCGGWRFSRYVALDLAYIGFVVRDDDVSSQRVKAKVHRFAPAVCGTLPRGPIERFARARYLVYDLTVEVGGEKYEMIDVSDNADALWLTGGRPCVHASRCFNLMP